MPKKSGSINLLSSQQISFFDRFINWALTAGRLVVILTELVALGAFLYRFSLDRQLIDLHSKIKQEQAIVEYLKDNEKTYRNLQDRLTLAKKYSDSAVNDLKTVNDILQLVPQGITLNDFSFTPEGIKISANSDSVYSLSLFANSLKTYPLIESVSIDKIENKPSNALITVGVSTSFKKDKNETAK